VWSQVPRFGASQLKLPLEIGQGHIHQIGGDLLAAVEAGLVPEEESSGERRRLGHISKQGNSLLRFLLVEAAQATVRSDGRWRNQFFIRDGDFIASNLLKKGGLGGKEPG
jgi:transposase IS116/IS110/IS902 family protein